MVTYDSSEGTDADLPNAISIDSSNNIYVAGYKSSANVRDWAIRKYTSTGQLDTTWGSGGMITYNSAGFSFDEANSITVDLNNNIYVVGQHRSVSGDNDWAIRKYTSTGQLDATWGSGGMVTYNSAGTNSDVAKSIVIDISNNIYVAGQQSTNGSDWAVHKYLDNGVLDNSPLLAVITEQATDIDYSLSNSGESNVIKTDDNAYTTNTITISGSGSITITATGMPPGVSVTYDDYRTCSPSPTCSSIITFTVPSTIDIDTYPITITGSPLGEQTTFNLVVSGSPLIVTCSASSPTAFINQTITWGANASGGDGNYSYVWSGTNISTSPAPNTSSFNMSYNTIGWKTTSVTVTDSSLPTSIQKSCTVMPVLIKIDPSYKEL